MADVVQLEEIAPKQTGGPTMVAPPVPPADRGALPSSSARTETRREKRRREWHEGKIRSSREKKQHNQATTPEEQIGHRDFQYARPESPFVSAQSPTCPATGGKRHHPSHGRTETQWKVIEALRLCAGCLTRTTPPHKPGDAHAPCPGQLNAPFDHAKIAVIRKALDKLKAEHRRSDSLGRPDTTSPQRNRQWRSGDTSSNASQCTLFSGIQQEYRCPEAGFSGYESGPLGVTYDCHAPSGGGLSGFAPLYNIRNLSSYLQPSVGSAAPGQGSAPQADDDLARPSASCCPPTVDAMGDLTYQAAAPSTRSADLLVGIAPATPLILAHPDELIEEDLGTIEEHAPLIAVIPDCESSSGVPKFKVEDWDTSTRGPEDLQEELIPDEDPILKKMIRFGDRSWTLQGLWNAVAGSEWGGSNGTLVDEPQELPSKQTIEIQEVIRNYMRPETRRSTS